jgi:hypothetical protein
MRILICLVAGAALCVTSQAAVAKGTFQLKKTSWTFTDTDGTKVKESIDADGKFIANSVAGKHLDHGTSLMKADKACFTSAMTKEGEVCWTIKPVNVGESLDTVSDKGKKLTVTRVDYAPMQMPK